MKPLSFVFLGWVFCVAPAWAADSPPPDLDFLRYRAEVPEEPSSESIRIGSKADAFHQACTQERSPERWWVRPGILADRESKQLWVWGQASGMDGGEPVEFYLAYATSGNAYETLFLSFAKPSDIHAGLEALGLSAGAPVDPAKEQFWPRGDRVKIQVVSIVPDATEAVAQSLEHYVATSTSPHGFAPREHVFTGSVHFPDPSDASKSHYAADQFEAQSISANFNTPVTVLDLPRQGTKGEVYGSQLAHPKRCLPEGHPVLLLFEPAKPADAPGWASFELTLKPGEAGALKAVLKGTHADARGSQDLPTLLEAFAQMRREGIEPYVSVNFDPDLPLGQVHKTCALLAELDVQDGIRIDPPPAGQLYYRAYLPDPIYRQRSRRPSQPWELRIHEEGSANLNCLTTVWGEALDTEPRIIEKRIEIPNVDALVSACASTNPPPPRALFVYAPPTLTQGQLIAFIQPIRERFPVVFVYLDALKPENP